MEPEYKVGEQVFYFGGTSKSVWVEILSVNPETEIHGDEYEIEVDGKRIVAYEFELSDCEHNYVRSEEDPIVRQCTKCGDVDIDELAGMEFCDPGYEPDDYEYPEGYNPFTDDRIEDL